MAAEELAGRKDGDKISLYRVTDIWEAPGLAAQTVEIPKLAPEDFWFFSAGGITHDILVEHMRRVNNADLNFPITLYSDGRLADGFHRILCADTYGLSTISVIKLIQDPHPVETMTTEEYLNR